MSHSQQRKEGDTVVSQQSIPRHSSRDLNTAHQIRKAVAEPLAHVVAFP